MARPRRELDAILKGILEKNGIPKTNLYFQPGNDIYLNYPCIIYSLGRIDTVNADNTVYVSRNKYDVTVISEDPDTIIPMDILKSVSHSYYSRRYIADNLYHDLLTLYF